MILKKLKKLVIPFIVVKFLIFIFVAFKSDLVSISRDINYSTNYQEGVDNDTIVLQRQKSIRIVRNEEEGGILIKLREKRNTEPFSEKAKITSPVVD